MKEIKEVVLSIDVEKLNIIELYYYFLLCEKLDLLCETDNVITSEDYD